jgi:hypothetical protein
MAAFIIISTDNSLHYLVDGIQMCRPLSNVRLCISTGKIIETDDGWYMYEYTVASCKKKSEREEPLNYWLSNQIAAFRKETNLSKDDIINIFLLENPLTADKYQELKGWIEAFKKVYDEGKGPETSLRLYHVLFTYDLSEPDDICKQIPAEILRQYIEDFKESTFNDKVFYIDNQNCDSQAVSKDKEDHDFKTPRFLLDFMMLASDASDSYNVTQSISDVQEMSRFFSVGYAESMYYYPDVERYYKIADQRDFFNQVLKSDDETLEDVSERSMDIERSPFGLLIRKKKLESKYQDVSFDKKILEFPDTSDKLIDDCVKALKPYIEQRHSLYLQDCEQRDQLKSEIAILTKEIAESEDEDSTKQENLKKLEDELNSLLTKIEDEYCPSYIDRDEIYANSIRSESEENQKEVEENIEQYKSLLLCIGSKSFASYLKECSSERKENHEREIPDEKESLPFGCWSKLLFWKNRNVLVKSGQVAEEGDFANNEQIASERNVQIINEQLRLKKKYIQFKRDCKTVEDRWDECKKLCDVFKLSEHTHHYYPLINLPKLKTEQEKTVDERRKDVINLWRKENKPELSKLIQDIERNSTAYAKQHFPYIDWDCPFSFVRDLDIDNMVKICNELLKLSSPFVNYNVVTMVAENPVRYYLYSDKKNFEAQFQEVKEKNKIKNGNRVTACVSNHIASKICAMQFLPITDSLLENLVDLQQIKKE